MSTGSETSKTTNKLPPALMANLQSVLLRRRPESDAVDSAADQNPVDPAPATHTAEEKERKPVVLVTNGEGIRSPGLSLLVEALLRGGLCDVHVCAPDSDKYFSGHSITANETLAATSVEFASAKAFEITGNPADCVSLALSGALFSCSKPTLVISGIDRGSNCGHETFYSGTMAAAREALMSGMPSIAISLNRKKGESGETELKDAVEICLPLINAAIRDIQNGNFPKSCILNLQIPTSPSANKGFKLTKRSVCRSNKKNWRAVPASRQPAVAQQFMSMQQSIGIQLAQLGRDASAAGAARRMNAQRKTVVVESVAAAGKPETYETVKKFFRLELDENKHGDLEEDADLRALQDGFISVTPLHLELHEERGREIQASVSDWLSWAL